MSDLATLINALYSAISPDTPIPVCRDNVIHDETDLTFLQDPTGLALSPDTVAGIAFVFKFLEEADRDIHEIAQLRPTATLFRDKQCYVLWALEEPATPEEALALSQALGMQAVDETVPLDWEVVHVDPNTFYPLSTLIETYGVSTEPDESQGVENEPTVEPVEPHNDAVVMRPYNPADYPDQIILSFAGGKDSMKWQPKPITIPNAVNLLTMHKEGKKDGGAIVLGDMVPGRRLKPAVKAMYALGLDIDDGTPVQTVLNALAKENFLAVVYSTHSHLCTRSDIKKDKLVKFADGEEINDELIQRYLREVEHVNDTIASSAVYSDTVHETDGIKILYDHDPWPKTRVIIFLKDPFVIADEGATQPEAYGKWEKILNALGKKLGLTFDHACIDVSRLFYLPRHPEGKPFEVYLFGGERFDWRKLQLNDPYEALVNDLTRGKSKSVTPEGKDLGRWSIKRAHGFQIADVIQEKCPERMRSGGGDKLEIECPFDENHSNAGDQDDRACFVQNAATGQSELFTISCRHETCRDKTNLDMLGKMLKDGWFDKEDIEDERYNALLDENAPEQPEAAKKIDKEDKARESFDDAIDALTKESTAADIEDVIKLIAEANVTDLAANIGLDRIVLKTGKKLTPLRKALKDAISKLSKESQEGRQAKDRLGRIIYRHRGGYDFQDATHAVLRGVRECNNKAKEPVFSNLDGGAVRLRYNFNAKTGAKRAQFDYITPTAFWSETNNLVTFCRVSDEGDGVLDKVPEDVARNLYEQAHKFFPPTPEVVYVPIFVGNGRLLNSQGYHFEAGEKEKDKPKINILMILNDLDVGTIPENPTREEALEALEFLRVELLNDFPFMDYDINFEERRAPSEAAAIAMLITPFMRRLIKGRTPVMFVEKPVAGTGGTLLAQLPMIIFDGEEGSAIRYSQNDEEMQKGLIAAVQERKSHLFFDDISDFNNRELLRAITAENISGRLLGSSKNITVPNDFCWTASGNNTAIKDEMRRRCVFIRIAALVADIQKRPFRHPDISGKTYNEWVKDNRSAVVRAILMMIQYWISVGMPIFKDRRRASFEDWSAKVGGVLQCLGIDGFLDNLTVFDEDMDQASIKEFMRLFLKQWGLENAVKPADIYEYMVASESDFISGVTEDQKKAKFMRRLPALRGQVYRIDDREYMMHETRIMPENDKGFWLLEVKEGKVRHQKKEAA